MEKNLRMLCINSTAHFFVDALCLAALSRAPADSRGPMVLVYNTLAFSTQCLTGMIIDRTGYESELTAAAMLAVALGFLTGKTGWITILLIGLGNSLFHAAAGTETLKRSRGRAADLGVFVAPGAVGVTVGTLWPRTGTILAAALVLLSFVSLYQGRRRDRETGSRPGCAARTEFRTGAVLLLTAAVAVRAVGGMAVTFPWRTGAFTALLMTAAVFAGKFLGGFLCDTAGDRKAAWISIPAASVLIAFFSGAMIPALAGQLLLNLTMPLTLFLMYRLMPSDPGLAFGLTASALWPGTIIGSLFQLTGPALCACVIVSFVFGLYAIIRCIGLLNQREER